MRHRKTARTGLIGDISRRAVLTGGAVAGATLGMAGAAHPFSIRLEIPGHILPDAETPFALRFFGSATAPAAPRRVEVFALGGEAPRLAAFRVGSDARPRRLAGTLRLSETRTVMAMAELADGRILHDQRLVRVV